MPRFASEFRGLSERELRYVQLWLEAGGRFADAPAVAVGACVAAMGW